MFNDDNNDLFSGMSSSPSNDRDRLEIDDSGVSKGERKREKQQERMNQMNDMQSGRGGRFNRGRFNKGNRGGRGQGSSWVAIILTLGLVAGLIYLPIAYRQGTLPMPLRSLIGGSAQNNWNDFTNNLHNFHKDSNKKFENRGKDNYDELVAKGFYDTNLINRGEIIGTQVEPEYMIYVYTSDEQDELFQTWIEKYEQSDTKNKFKIYRVSIEEGEKDYYIQEAIENNDYQLLPMLLLYHTPEKGKTVLDSIITDPDMLDKVPEYLTGLMNTDNKNF